MLTRFVLAALKIIKPNAKNAKIITNRHVTANHQNSILIRKGKLSSQELNDHQAIGAPIEMDIIINYIIKPSQYLF